MIENEGITIQSKENPLLFWRPESEILSNIIIALMLTIISYQTTAIIIDLLFGLKPSGISKVSDLMLSQLMHRSSLTSLHRQFRPQKRTGDPSQTSTFCHPICLKLFLVLLLAPFINIATIVPTLTVDTTLTFSEAGLGGLAFGIHPRSHTEKLSFTPITSSCVKANTEFGTHSSSLVHFTKCCQIEGKSYEKSGFANVQMYTIRTTPSITFIPKLIVRLISPGRLLHMTTSLQMIRFPNSHHGEFDSVLEFDINFQQNDIDLLVDDVVEMFNTFCGSKDAVIDVPPQEGLKYSLYGGKEVRCEPSDEEGKSSDWLEKVAQSICSRVSFVNSDEMKVLSSKFTPINVDDFPLVRRTRILSSPAILLIVMLNTVVIRAIVKFYARNDVSQGLGLAVREALQLPCCDTMLSRNDMVLRYGDDEPK